MSTARSRRAVGRIFGAGCWLAAFCAGCSPSVAEVDGWTNSKGDGAPGAAADLAGADLSANEIMDGSMIDAAPLGTRDWSRYPAIVQVDTTADIIAVGDVHGDFDTISALLAGAGVLSSVAATPTDVHWAAGNDVLVCTGDLIDKGSHSLDVLAFFMALSAAAAQAGGQVIVTTGNHEAEFLANPSASNTDTAEFVAELQAAGIAPADVGSGAVPLGQYLRNLPFAARVNDWFFCHAGNTAGRTIAGLETAFEAAVDGSGWAHPTVTGDDSMLEARISDGTPAWWTVDGADYLTTLATFAGAVNASHIVMGHQPGAFTGPDGKKRKQDEMDEAGGVLFFIDVGMSVGVDDTKGPLMIIQSSGGLTTAKAVYKNGSTSTVWKG